MVVKKPVMSPAEIPPMLSQKQRDALVYTPQCRQRWGERHMKGPVPLLEAEDIDEFLSEFARLKETELALQCLYDEEFNVPKAVKLLHAERRDQSKARRNIDKILTPEIYKKSIATHGKRFHLVKQALGEAVNTRDVIRKYYLWKRSDDFKEWQKHRKVKKKTKAKKYVARLHRWADMANNGTKDVVDYHNQLCELCATGGNLLRCDGCPRAYHLSCAQPPIIRFRNEDQWFCISCQKVFGGPTPKRVASDENEYCMVYHRGPSFPRSLFDTVTDASSYEDEDEQEDDSNEEDEDVTRLEASSEVESDDNAMKDRSTQDVVWATKSESVTDTALETSSTTYPSALPKTDRSKRSKLKPKNSPVTFAPVVKQERIGEDLVARPSSAGKSMSLAELSPVEQREIKPERSGISRKRHRKMLAPRRIAPS